MATHADNESPPQLTERELRTRKAFVGLDVAATRALRALRPWMEAHVHEVVEEFYAHLLRFEQPRWLLADPQRLAHVKAAQTDSLLSFTAGQFDVAYVASRLAIGRTHARVGVTPQWYLGGFSTFARILFPKILAHYQDRPLTGVAAIKALIAVMHLDMQLAIDAYLEASQEALQQSATALEEQVAQQTSALEERARQLETLYLVSAASSRELDLDKVLASALPLIVDVVGAAGAEVFLMGDEGASLGCQPRPNREFCGGLADAPLQPGEGILRASAGRPGAGAGGRSEPESRCSPAVSWPSPAVMRPCYVYP